MWYVSAKMLPCQPFVAGRRQAAAQAQGQCSGLPGRRLMAPIEAARRFLGGSCPEAEVTASGGGSTMCMAGAQPWPWSLQGERRPKG
jgi:hypothetical protein